MIGASEGPPERMLVSRRTRFRNAGMRPERNSSAPQQVVFARVQGTRCTFSSSTTVLPRSVAKYSTTQVGNTKTLGVSLGLRVCCRRNHRENRSREIDGSCAVDETPVRAVMILRRIEPGRRVSQLMAGDNRDAIGPVTSGEERMRCAMRCRAVR